MNPFKLDFSIALWRRSRESNRAFTREDLDELEQHLRDQVAGLAAQGMPEEEAFRVSLAEMGEYGAAESEYRKVYLGKVIHQHGVTDELRHRLDLTWMYLKSTLRQVARHRGYAAINLAGLSIGFACTLLIGTFIWHEYSYDTFHDDVDSVYRINARYIRPEGDEIDARGPMALPAALRTDFPDLPVVAGISFSEYWIRHRREAFKEDVAFADSTLFDLFSFPVRSGEPRSAIRDQRSAVVSQAFARLHLGSEEPVGELLDVGGEVFTIAAVVDIPTNSSIRFGVMLSRGAAFLLDPSREETWWAGGTYTFVRVADSLPAGRLAGALPGFLERHLPDFLKDRMHIELQPLRGSHLSMVSNHMAPPTAPLYLEILAIIGGAILLIACINFVNLTTALSSTRWKEMGVRKVMGARRGQLVGLFLVETFAVGLVAVVLSLGLAFLLLPLFNAATSKPMDIPLSSVFFAGISVFGSGIMLVSGLIPARSLSAGVPVFTLRGAFRGRGRGLSSRRLSVVVQFAVCSALITGLFVIAMQLRYVNRANLGYDPERVLVVDTQRWILSEPDRQLQTFRNTLVAEGPSAGIRLVSASEHAPRYYYGNTFALATPEGGRGAEVNVTSIDEGFLDTYAIPLEDGRSFAVDRPADREQGVIVNESGARLLGTGSPVGKEFRFAHGEGPYRVIGVVHDFHFESLQYKIKPQVYRYAWPGRDNYLSIRIEPGMERKAVAFLTETWRRSVAEMPLQYAFVQDVLRHGYDDPARTARIVGGCTLLAIFISCLGLLGLSAFAAGRRTKEIGIRKALGASVSGVAALLTWDFLKPVSIAYLVSLPVSYLAMQRWLDSFAYRIELGPGAFLPAGALSLGIALTTVGVLSIRAALADPVKSLRYE